MKSIYKIGLVALAVTLLVVGVGNHVLTVRAASITEEPDSALQKAADFTLTDTNGKAHTLSAYKGKIVVLEWVNPECPFVKRHYDAGTMANTAKAYADKDVVWLAVNSSHHFNQAKNKAFVEKYDLKYAVLDDSAGKVGKSYDAKTTPHMYVIDKAGNIAYKGAIDDDPRGDKAEKKNYVKAAIDELLAGKAVTTAETKPYGCSVKYAQ